MPRAWCRRPPAAGSPRAAPLPRSSSRKEGDRVDLDAESVTGEARDLDRRARWSMAAEDTRVDLVHPRELLHVHEKHAAADHVLHAGPRRRQDRRDVLQYLL